jgi:hypothetical protein
LLPEPDCLAIDGGSIDYGFNLLRPFDEELTKVFFFKRYAQSVPSCRSAPSRSLRRCLEHPRPASVANSFELPGIFPRQQLGSAPLW